MSTEPATTVKEIEFDDAQRRAVDLCTTVDTDHRIVCVTGPAGSGKSTTMARMIDTINTQRACHIITIEDPIEFLFKHKKSVIEQRELNNDTHSFSDAPITRC